MPDLKVKILSDRIYMPEYNMTTDEWFDNNASSLESKLSLNPKSPRKMNLSKLSQKKNSLAFKKSSSLFPTEVSY